jgi:dUTP pyrophosphatase
MPLSVFESAGTIYQYCRLQSDGRIGRMELKIRRFDKSIPLPEYKTEGAVAMDLAAREDTVIPPGAVVPVPCNVAIEFPPGYFVLMAGRSSLSKRGLTMANGVGIIDRDYAGDNDEYKAILRNFTEDPVTVQKGDRIVQIMVIPYERFSLKEVDSLGRPDRGGIGSTGI